MAKKTTAKKTVKKKTAPAKKSGPELEKKPAPGKLFPEAKMPKDMVALAKKMKKAELERKRQAGIEGDARNLLCAKMIQKGFSRFLVEVDGQEYEFELKELTKVTSHRTDDED